MIVTMTVHPLFNNDASGEEIARCVTSFTEEEVDDATQELGRAIIEAILDCRRADNSITAFEMRVTLELEIEDDEKRSYIIEENTTYRIDANSAEEAEAIWLDKGVEAAEFIGVSDRDVYPA